MRSATTSSNTNRFGTPERRHIEQIVFPTLEEAQAAADAAGKIRTHVRGARQGARPDREGHRSRPRDQVRHHRSGRRERGIRAEGRRDQRAGQGHVRHDAGPRGQDRAGEHQAVRRGRAPRSSRRSRPTARAANLPRVHDKIEDERAAGLRLTEVAQKLGLKARTIEAVDRAGPRSRRQADRRPAGRRRCDRECVRARTSGVENEPVQMAGGGYRLVRGAGRQAVARAHARRGTRRASRNAGARIRSPSASRPRPPRWSTSSRPARRSTMSRPPKG